MHVAQFVHRYPPALGGAEAYTQRLCEHLAAQGDNVTVWTTTAVELGELWRANPERQRCGEEEQPHDERRRKTRSSQCNDFKPCPLSESCFSSSSSCGCFFLPHPIADAPGSPAVRRYRPLHFPARRYLLKTLSLVPVRRWQCLTTPCNPMCPRMWRDAGTFAGPLDAVHATAFPYSFPIVCGLRLARRRGVPFFLTPFLHLGDPTDPHDHTRRQYTRPHLRWLLQQADGVFVQTRLERDTAVSLGVPPERVHLQGLGVDAGECTGGDRGKTRNTWGATGNEAVIGHLANASEEKGTCDLLRAAERAWAAGHRFRVVLAGPEMPNFRRFWETFGAKHRVSRLGVVNDAGKCDFFAGIDAFALPSRTDSFGLVLLEAWANGKPNLVYRAGGPGELVCDGIDGLHAKCGDVAELAVQLGRLVSNPGLRRMLGDNGLSRVDREFRWHEKLEFVWRVLTRWRIAVAA